MTAFVVAPSLDLCLVTKRGVVQVEACDARVGCPCWRAGQLLAGCKGIPLTVIPPEFSHMEYELRRVQTMFEERQRVRGYERVSELVLHGPFLSYDYEHTLADIQRVDPNLRDENGDELPGMATGVVFEREENGFRDYVFVGDFLARAQLTEVIV